MNDELSKLWKEVREGLAKNLEARKAMSGAEVAAELKAISEASATCMCARCQSLREVNEALDNPEKSAARAALPWRWCTIVTKHGGKIVGACFSEGRDSDEAIYRALFSRYSPGGDEFHVSCLKVGFVPFGRWTGRNLTPEEWEKFNTMPTEQIGVQLDE